MNILGVDPGQKGAMVLINEWTTIKGIYQIPLTKEKDIDWAELSKLMQLFMREFHPLHVFLERAMPMAMGSKHAFNYGRHFAMLEIAFMQAQFPVTYVEPAKWSKVIHEGIDSDLKPKAKSRIALHRLYPKHVQFIPKTTRNNFHEGILEAFLIAAYGHRLLKYIRNYIRHQDLK